MDIPRQNKLMTLFLSEYNPLWDHIFDIEGKNRKAINSAVGKVAGSVDNWREGHPLKPASSKAVFENTISAIRAAKMDEDERATQVEIVRQFQVSFNDPGSTTAYEAAQILGMGIDRCQRIIDAAYYDRLPLFPHLLYEKDDECKYHFDHYRGLYIAHFKRENIWLRCPLRIRYPLDIGKGIAIRCKLNLPSIDREEGVTRSYWEYDGFLAVRAQRIFWMFEQRQPSNADYIYFVTNIGVLFQDHLTLWGSYLSTGQDEQRSVVNGDAFLQRIEIEDVEQMEHGMHQEARPIRNPVEADSISKLLAAAQARR